ncbi:hypothetical protein [Streptomyces sp. NPDC048516]|uniref:hypothetical protein n=1 Tax=Streptomyces sp. NPDC048516 TaxID=3365565 RepID=UPI00371CD642
MSTDRLKQPTRLEATLHAVLEVLAGAGTDTAAAQAGLEPTDLGAAVDVYQQAGQRALAEQVGPPAWRQLYVQFTEWDKAERIAADYIAPFTAVARAVWDASEPTPPHLRMFRVRMVLAAIDLAEGCEAQAQPLHDAIVSDTTQAGDTYAAREILRHPSLWVSERSRRKLDAIARDGALDQGNLPETVLSTMMHDVNAAGARLVHCLTEQGAASQG